MRVAARERSTSVASPIPMTKISGAAPAPSSWTTRERSVSSASAPSRGKEPARRPSLASVNTGPAHAELRKNDDGFDGCMHREWPRGTGGPGWLGAGLS